jgi:hypothetical protein
MARFSLDTDDLDATMAVLAGRGSTFAIRTATRCCSSRDD